MGTGVTMIETVFTTLSDFSLLEILAIIFSAGLAGFLRGFVGFGGAIAVVLVLNLVFGPLTAIPIASLIGMPSTVQLLPTIIRHAERRFVTVFSISCIIAAPAGAFVLVAIDPDLMKIIISIFVLIMVGLLHLNLRPKPSYQNSDLETILAGVISGLIQGAAAVGGPPAVLAALSRPGDAVRQRANVLGTVSTLNFCAFVPFWYLGLYNYRVLVVSLLVVPIYMLSTSVGAHFFSTTGHRHYRPAALLTLAVLGTITLGVAVHAELVN